MYFGHSFLNLLASKRSHWKCLLSQRGEVVDSSVTINRILDLKSLSKHSSLSTEFKFYSALVDPGIFAMAHIHHILQYRLGASIYVRRFFSIGCRILIVYIISIMSIEHKMLLELIFVFCYLRMKQLFVSLRVDAIFARLKNFYKWPPP